MKKKVNTLMDIERQLQNEYESMLVIMLIGSKDEDKRNHIVLLFRTI